jgi:predicted nucleic acid-binding protein
MTHMVDTSMLVRQADINSADRPLAIQALTHLAEQGERLCTVPQNMIEFWVVATRPQAVNGLGLSTADADAERRRLETLFPVLPDPPDLYLRWVSLVNQFGVSGKPAHDARIVAAMLAHGITHILTFNGRDFLRYAALGIIVIDPVTVE